jgi:hypothetical protein
VSILTYLPRTHWAHLQDGNKLFAHALSRAPPFHLLPEKAADTQAGITTHDKGTPIRMHNFVKKSIANPLRTRKLNERQSHRLTGNGNMSGTQQAQADFVHRSQIRGDQVGIVMGP